MLAIKLKLVGRRNQRTFRVIVQEARAKLGGNFVEDLGWYNPHSNQIKVNKDRVQYWIDNGAQPTETVDRLLKKTKTSEVETYTATKKRPRKLTRANKAAKADELSAEGAAQVVSSPGAEASREKGKEGVPDAESSEETPTGAPTEEKPEEKPAEEAEETLSNEAKTPSNGAREENRKDESEEGKEGGTTSDVEAASDAAPIGVENESEEK